MEEQEKQFQAEVDQKLNFDKILEKKGIKHYLDNIPERYRKGRIIMGFCKRTSGQQVE
jgi:hypothetical protein